MEFKGSFLVFLLVYMTRAVTDQGVIVWLYSPCLVQMFRTNVEHSRFESMHGEWVELWDQNYI